MDFYQHVFAGNPLDRGEVERRDEDWIASRATDPDSRFLPMRGPHVLVSAAVTGNGEPALGWLGWQDLAPHVTDPVPLLLGMQEGTTYFAIDLGKDEPAAVAVEAMGGYRFEEARAAAETVLSPAEAGIMAQGRAQVNWHSRHGFCSVCGQATLVKRGGQKRECPACRAEHFPRTDPVIIMLVSDGDRCLLGQSRGRLQAMNRYSALAGFMDQGEAIEEAVAREVMEEAGIRVKQVRYHSSQPWPFPSSLMIGCHAEADSTSINMDNEEMTDVQWFDRSEVLLALEEKSEKLRLPGPIAIAHHLIRAWAYREV
ncbi:MAG: NAD(+) diphosphatase [Chloroflexi bacterium]|nr:NAD(+) diphosphatase [Chloroflexota bacterium]